MEARTIVSEIKALNTGKTSQKRDFLIQLIFRLELKLNFKLAFIDSVSKPFMKVEPNQDMDQLIDGILGYYIYLSITEFNEGIFLHDTLYDMRGFIKFGLDNFKPKTKNYNCYLKYR